ncbi:YeiH family protein [Geomesophilobacter sediminis]|uniref:Putative sulfate exporter family transporter n=1 Tax=Geomesophilobacter sediminis TaxID=2798584 RepID=A0A8J7J0J7_9BACT|nr:putative sulfate exporter family transporter [Geomesophilobacter sediminis]MBJ6723928.1 putative sulfate exporter family transporter [Geomesophilobacter sediminis]
MNGENLKKMLFVACLVAAASPEVSTAMALVTGVLFSLILGNPWHHVSGRWSKMLLQVSVVGLGFGLSLGEVAQAGGATVYFTVIGIGITLTLGYVLGRLLKVDGNTSALISFGTAICGGSAIAAMAPVLKAKDHEIAVSLATVFLLNSVALLLFPALGHWMHLNENIFGTWAGLAIHDTSSVVGAAAAYGKQALAVGTTVKLSRAIWITPVVIAAGAIKRSNHRVGVPLFIVGFLVAATIRTVLPQFHQVYEGAASVARQALVVCLFLIGAGLSRDLLKKVGLRPLLQGVALWFLVSCVTLTALLLIGIR